MFLLTSSLPAPRKAAALRASDAAAAAGASTRRRLSQVLQRALWLCLALAAACAGAAEAPPQAATPPQTVLTEQRGLLDEIRKQLDNQNLDAAELPRLRASALQAQERLEGVATELQPALDQASARLAELGTAPAPNAAKETSTVASRRSELEAQRKTLDSQVKLAKLLALESGQLADKVAELRRSRFAARVGERSAFVFGSVFWRELRAGGARDLARLGDSGRRLVAAAAAPSPWVWLVVAGGCAGLLLAWSAGSRLLLRLSTRRVPPGRLRRSLLALLLTLLCTVGAGLVAQLIRLTLVQSLSGDEPLANMLEHGVGMVCFGAYVTALGRALLSAGRPTWRLIPVSDATAAGLSSYPLLLALALAGGTAAEHAVGVLQASLASTVAVNLVVTLLQALVMGMALRRALHLRSNSDADADDHAATSGGAIADATGTAPGNSLKAAPGTALAKLPWANGAAALVAGVLVVAIGSALLGYVALGSFLVKQLAWSATVLATVYLVNALLDDFFSAWLGTAPVPPTDDEAPAHAPRIRAQAGVLLSALSRLAVLLFAAVLVMAPFGQGPGELFDRAGQLRDGVAIGAVRLHPATVMQGLLVFALAALTVRLLQRWLRERYLPTTRLDAAMRDSATSLLGFVGIFAAFALALSAVGLGLERIAWVASALSVGIGFGLQAVVSNFVSGLILLAERPVKVGDWVSLSGVEGDIRRISVRATEIQMGDRSTVIVPNSEFITKIVRNVTLSNPLGLISLKFPMPLDTDVEKVREIVLAAFAAHESVLETPAPNIFLDSIDSGHLLFNANASVASPRQTYGVRSALLFDILARFRVASLPLAKPTMVMLRDESPAVPSAAPAAGPGASQKAE